MYILAEDATTLNKIPYTAMEIQKEIATTLLKSAESILQKKVKHFTPFSIRNVGRGSDVLNFDPYFLRYSPDPYPQKHA